MNNSKLRKAGSVLVFIVALPLAAVIAGVTVAALVFYGIYLVELATR